MLGAVHWLERPNRLSAVSLPSEAVRGLSRGHPYTSSQGGELLFLWRAIVGPLGDSLRAVRRTAVCSSSGQSCTREQADSTRAYPRGHCLANGPSCFACALCGWPAGLAGYLVQVGLGLFIAPWERCTGLDRPLLSLRRGRLVKLRCSEPLTVLLGGYQSLLLR